MRWFYFTRARFNLLFALFTTAVRASSKSGAAYHNNRNHRSASALGSRARAGIAALMTGLNITYEEDLKNNNLWMGIQIAPSACYNPWAVSIPLEGDDAAAANRAPAFAGMKAMTESLQSNFPSRTSKSSRAAAL